MVKLILTLSNIQLFMSTKWSRSTCFYRIIWFTSKLHVYARPAKSGKWRKCHSQKFLDYAEFANVNSMKQRIYMFFFSADFWIFWEILNIVEIFHWKLQQNKGSFYLLKSFVHRIYNIKVIFNFIYKKQKQNKKTLLLWLVLS